MNKDLRSENERLERILLGQAQLIAEVGLILDEEQKHDDILRAMVLSSVGSKENHISRLDPDRIFLEDEIRTLCVKYRLRFLDGGRFKGELPVQAIYELRRLEARAKGPVRGFKIMAPAARFRLCDTNADPLLFVPVGPKHYYLVHRWGNDMSPMRSVLVWPFRTLGTLAASLVLLALVAAAFTPSTVITTDPSAGWWGAHRVLFFFWSTMMLAGFTIFSWFAFHGRFSSECWNSRTFN